MYINEKYRSFTAHQFVADEYFISWVKFADEKSDLFWTNFLTRYPEKREDISKARRILKGISLKEETLSEEKEKIIWNKIASQINSEGKVRSRPMIRRLYPLVAAASVVLILLAGYFFLYKPDKNASPGTSGSIATAHDIAPGGNKAILTLSDGSTIVLDSTNNGAISKQDNITVIKLNDGEISYKTSSQNHQSATANRPITYNTITTPRGGQYQLILADGTKVWLNAESSLRYPTAFVGNERKVTLTGEGYFEVAHDKTKPFYVSVGDMNVKVLGTHFNVNAYGDDGAIKTTLLEGKVNVSTGSQSSVLQPGEQARIKGNNMEVRKDVNTEEVISWKNGLFYFDNADIEVVMGQLTRWYDVDVVYEGSIPKRRFAGEMQKNLTLAQVLKLLSQNKINFEIQGKKLIVKP